jgi:DNA-directed RNA polymerase alpha subunit
MYEDWKSRSIEDVGLSVRVSNCLRRNVENKNDLTVGRFSKMTILEIRRMRGIGEVALNEIKFRFNALGVTLIDDRLMQRNPKRKPRRIKWLKK